MTTKMEEAQSQNVPHIYHIGIKIPTFWPEYLTIWFAQLEAHFAIAKITQDYTKYYPSISQLEGPVIINM